MPGMSLISAQSPQLSFWQSIASTGSSALPSSGQHAWMCPRSFLPSPLPGLALRNATGQTTAPSPALMLKDLSLPMPLPPAPRTVAPLQEVQPFCLLPKVSALRS